jgi:hypothetical protein
MEISNSFADVTEFSRSPPLALRLAPESSATIATPPRGAAFSGSETAEQSCVAATESEPNRYQKYHKIIKDILFMPVSIVGFCIVIVSVGIMAILGGFVLVFYIIKGICYGVANDSTRIYKYMFEPETEIVTVANVVTDVVDVHIIDVNAIDIISENNMNHEQFPIAVAINKRQIIPL